MRKQRTSVNVILTIVMIALSCVFIAPILIVLMNSFKGKLFISDQPFTFPTFEKQDLRAAGIQPKTFVGVKNYVSGIEKIHFWNALGYSVFITVASVVIIVLFTAMTAWFITRIKTRYTSSLYYLFVFSMIIPFQMVMFAMTKVANVLHLDNPVGILVLYLGFGAGMSVFMFSGFVKGIPIDIEEAATIDGANKIQQFYKITLPLLKGIIKTNLTFWSINTITFFLWSKMFSPISSEASTIVPVVYLYDTVFGSTGNTERDAGAGAAVGVVLAIFVGVIYLITNKLLKDDDLEF